MGYKSLSVSVLHNKSSCGVILVRVGDGRFDRLFCRSLEGRFQIIIVAGCH